MNLKHLSYFVDISKRESFTKAADDIYVSQSALSKSVKSLEQELNVTLIDRTSKSFNLTEEGKILFSEGEKLLQYIDESQNEIIEKICKEQTPSENRCASSGIDRLFQPSAVSFYEEVSGY